MKTSLFSFSVLLVICLCGCSSKSKYVELTKETFSKLDASKVTEVYLLSPTDSGRNLEHVKNWVSVKKKIFPITEPNKISTIINCIREGCSTPSKMRILQLEINVVFISGLNPGESSAAKRDATLNIFPINDSNQIDFLINYLRDQNVGPMIMPGEIAISTWIFFKSEKTNYGTILRWDNESVYGDWWESPELFRNFKLWEIKERSPTSQVLIH
jgi:hypothetical protein